MSDVAPTPFERLGGEAAVRALVDRFYDLMDTRPDVRTLRELHASSLTASRDNLFWFMCGWLGGPSYYVERKGHPRLRARHLPFRIDREGAAQWMQCMRQAMTEQIADAELRTYLDDALTRLADHMRNVPEPV